MLPTCVVLVVSAKADTGICPTATAAAIIKAILLLIDFFLIISPPPFVYIYNNDYILIYNTI